VRVADEGGLALVGIQDHPYQRHFLDTWSLIPTLLAETKRIAFFTDVANLPLRPPAVMAKAAASLDVLSGGRFELGLGAGGFPDVIAGMGGPRRTPGESVEALDEAIDVIRLMWSSEPSVSFDGKHYRAGHELIDAAAEKAGRDPRSIRRILNLQGVIGDKPPPPRSSLPVGYLAGEPLAGPPDWWVETLGGFVADGFDTLVFWPVDAAPDQVELLAGEVVPRLRDRANSRA